MEAITTTLQTSFTEVGTNILAIVGVATAAALSFLGVKWAVVTGISFFKSLKSK